MVRLYETIIENHKFFQIKARAILLHMNIKLAIFRISLLMVKVDEIFIDILIYKIICINIYLCEK